MISPSAQYASPAPYAGQCPTRNAAICSRSASRVANSRSRRVLPTPAWPMTVTRWGRPSRTTRSKSDMSRPDSSSRPISGAALRKPRAAVGGLADRDAAGPRGRLEPRGHVHDVADHRVAVADLPGQDLAGVDAHAQREPDPGGSLDVLVDLVHRRLHREPRPDRALGVVLVG